MKKLDSHRMDFNKACYLGFFDLEDPGVDGRIILKLTCERLDGGMDSINLAQDKDRWRALVNAVMNLRVP
jgi:hypothetical protein